MTRGSKIGSPQAEAEPRAAADRRAPHVLSARRFGCRIAGAKAHDGRGLPDSDRRALARIDAALERIQSGSYGYCLRCGAPIGGERLETDPAVAFCQSCETHE